MPITITKTITDEQLACMANDLVGFPNNVAVMTVELQRRIDWVIDHKVEQCISRIVKQQSHLLGSTRPSNDMEAAKLIVVHPDFETRDKRETQTEDQLDGDPSEPS